MSDEKNTTLNIDDTLYRTEVPAWFLKRKSWQPIDHNKIISFIPGTILEVFIKEGDKVKQGDRLLILEAMKMRNKVEAPKDGIIKKIYITNGQVVPKNTLLIELE